MRKNMIVFLDTEFTDLHHPALLSIGLVTLDGREFYAELDLTTDAGKARKNPRQTLSVAAACWNSGVSYQALQAQSGK